MRAPLGVVALGNVSGLQVVDASRGSLFSLTINGATTISLRNVRAGVPCVILVTQSGDGGHALAWNGAGGQSVSGFTTVSPTAGSTSAFVLWGSANDMSAVVSVSNPSSGGGGPVTSVWEMMTITGDVISKTEPIALAGAGGITADLSLSDCFTVGPLVNNVQLTFTNKRAGHLYTFKFLQSDFGEVTRTVNGWPSGAPIVGNLQGLTNDVIAEIGGVSVREYWCDGTNMYIVGGDDFSP